MTRPAEPRRPSSARRRLAVGVVAVLLVGAAGCAESHKPRPGGATTRQAEEARKQAEAMAAAGAKAAADAQFAAHPELHKKNLWEKITGTGPTVPVSVKVSPAPPSPPPAPKPTPALVAAVAQAPPPAVRGELPVRAAARGIGPVVIRERVASAIPYPTEAEAEDRALKDAQDRIEQKLRELDPPVDYRPSLAVVKNEYVRGRNVRDPNDEEKAAIAKAGYAPDRVYVEYTVELTAGQVRALRTRDRVTDGLRGLGVITAVALAGFLFLRLDEWTKGYLTSWLAVGAAALGGGVVAALVFV